MKVSPQHTGPYYQQLWVESYIKHVDCLNTIVQKSPPRPIKLKTSHSVMNLQNDPWFNMSNQRLFKRYKRMPQSQKQNVVLNMTDVEIGERLSKNLECIRKRNVQGIKSQNLSLLRRLQQRITNKNQFTVLFRSQDKTKKTKKKVNHSKFKKKVKLPEIKYSNKIFTQT